MKETASRKIVNYADIPTPQFVDIIFKGVDVAMYYLLHERLKNPLYKRYKNYSLNLYDDFEDVVDDFIFYIRESGQTPYQVLQRINKEKAFESWLLNTFHNYLSNRSKAESHIPFLHIECEKLSLPADSSSEDREKMIHIASQLIAYALQVFCPRRRFIFLRSLLTILYKHQAVPDKEMAEALGISYGSYHTTLNKIKRIVGRLMERLLNGESLRLDDRHEILAKRIDDDFFNLYPILFDCYIQCIDTLKTSAAVKKLRNQYIEERSFVVHEPSIPEQTQLSIVQFWGKLNRWLIPGMMAM